MKKIWLAGLIGLMSYGGYSLGSAQERQESEKHQVVYSPKVTNFINYIYDKKTKEFPLCVLGKREGNTYYVNDLRIPSVSQSTDSKASYNGEDCTSLDGYLGVAHNHPGETLFCEPGGIDLKRFINDERAQIEIIVCRVNSDSTQADIKVFYKELLSQGLINLFKRGSY